MEQKVPVPEVPPLRPTRQKEFVELIDAIHLHRTQDVTKRWVDFMGREIAALTQILVPKVIEDIKDINYIRGMLAGLAMANAWPLKLIKQREKQIKEEEEAKKEKKVEAQKKDALSKKQRVRQKKVDEKLKGGKTNGGS